MKLTIHSCVFDKQCRDDLNWPEGYEFEDGLKMPFPWEVSFGLKFKTRTGDVRRCGIRLGIRPWGASMYNVVSAPWPKGAKTLGMTATEDIYYDADDNVIERRQRMPRTSTRNQ